MGDILLPEFRRNPMKAFIVCLHLFRLLAILLHDAEIAMTLDAHTDNIGGIYRGSRDRLFSVMPCSVWQSVQTGGLISPFVLTVP